MLSLVRPTPTLLRSSFSDSVCSTSVMSPPSLWFILWFWFLVTLVRSQSPVRTFFPASIPLSIRSPFMSVWQVSTNGSDPLSHSWPRFWGQQSIMGWAGKIRVDGQTYSWMGQDYAPPLAANVTNVQITPTRSIFVMQAGPMNVTVTFLSPIEPADWVLQSLPFSYVSVEASSLDGQSHNVQVYSDISAEWLSGDRTNSIATWTHHTSSNSIYHEIKLETPQEGVEINHQAQDGTAYYAMALRPGMSWQIDRDVTARGQFNATGVLTDTTSQAFATISPVFTVFAIAVDLGQIQSTSAPIAWAVGYVRNPSIAYTGPDGATKQLSPYFVTKYGDNIDQTIDDFTSAFATIEQKCIALDEAIIANASKVSSHYADLVSLATRQAMASFDITVSTGSDGKPNASDVRIFMKDIGSSSTAERVNPVERMYAALPALIYFNASLVGPMLAPLLDAQDSLSGLSYAAQDIGIAYPNATGTHGGHTQGIEQSGNMLIMLYAHARFSGDGSLLHKHYNLTKRWADYLVNESLTPSNQMTADNESNANMTNLAIKGIIGVKAMAEISRALGEDFDAQQYESHAAALVGQWQSLALSTDQKHILGTYGNQQSWALMYNLYADRLLGTNIVNQALLQGQTAFYNTLLQSAPVFGLPLDNTVGGTSAAWLLFTAATVLGNGVRDSLIEGVWARASSNVTGGAFPDQYDAATGSVLEGSPSPALGAMYSFLALNVPNTTITVSLSGSGDPGSSGPSNGDSDGGDHKSSVGAIAGGVVGGIAAVALVALGVFLFLRKRRHERSSELEKIEIVEEPHRPALSPYNYDPHESLPVLHSANALESGFLAHEMVRSDTALVPPAPEGLAAARSSKLRELSLNARLAYAPSVSGSSNTASHTGSASSRDPLSPGESRTTRSGSRTTVSRTAGSSSVSPTEVLGLREEVENLRRVMQELRAERLEPPPEYTG
ncbi:DUF1793-domain-containing protein [Trametes cingulata]|nr:DUF1793-domain-containing protein [Trametes cingulata]